MQFMTSINNQLFNHKLSNDELLGCLDELHNLMSEVLNDEAYICNIEAALDFDKEEIILIYLCYENEVPAISGTDLNKIATKVRKFLLDKGEARFPHFVYDFAENQKFE